MTSSEEPRLLAAIGAAPDDDGPRMVYADWLQQRGDPRGELIAVQCALARASGPAPRWCPDGDRLAALAARERELLDRHEAEWLAAAGLAVGEGELVRGLVERVDTTAARVAGAIDRIAALPGLRSLRAAVDLAGSERELLAIAARLREAPPAALERVVIDRHAQWDAQHCDEVRRSGARLSIYLDEPVRAPAAVAVFEGMLAQLPGTAAIEIALCGRGRVELDELFARVIALGPRPALRALDVRFANGAARDWVQWIATRKLGELLARCPGLTELTLPMAELWLEELAHPGLERLALSWLGYTPYGPADTSVWGAAPAPRGSGLAFLRSARLPALEQLAIDFQYDWYVGWLPEDIAALCAAAGLPRLARLTLRYSLLGDELCRRLPDAPFAGQLEELDLTATEVSEAGARALLERRDAFPRLRRLVCLPFDEVRAETWARLEAAYPICEPP